MKLAIITNIFTDSTLGLVEALSKYGHSVDFYLCVFNKHECSLPCFDFKTGYRSYGQIMEVRNGNGIKGISFGNYFPNTHIYIYQGFPIGMRTKGLTKYIVEKICSYYLKPLAKIINRNSYDFVDIISQLNVFADFEYMIHTHVVHSYHEVLDQHLMNPVLLPIIENKLLHGNHIRVFSDKSRSDILNNCSCNKELVHCIPFGLYNCYRDFGDVIVSEIGRLNNYILFFGYIAPYKGLSILYNASKEISKDIKIVIAGRGNDPILNEIRHDDRFIIINRIISNDELAVLITNCRFIVCPYLSASQSGIPLTAFYFAKPVIATTVGSFDKLIIPQKTGLLIPPKDIIALANSIRLLYDNDDLYSSICHTISNIEEFLPEFSWGYIAQQYTEMIRQITKVK